jgi:TolB-like protein/DNA-binding SARP family transcriptional activator
MAPLQVRLFGDFEIEGDGPLPGLPGQKDRALLAVLALAGGRPVPRDRLAGLLWGDRGSAQARDSVKHALAALRQALAPAAGALEADRTAVRLDPDRVAVDVARFETALARGTPAEDALALDLYRGPFLDSLRVADAGFQDWCAVERARLHRLAEAAAARLLEAALAGTDPSAVIAAADRLLALDPHSEEACRALIRGWSQRGEPGRAVTVFQRFRDRLSRDLGVAPEAETARLAAAIRARRPPPDPLPLPPGDAPVAGPALAVLPFRNAGGDPDQQHLADGIAEDLIAALAQYRWFPVLSRNASFAFRDSGLPVAEIARSLGARYLLDGSVRRAGDRLRLAGQLVDGASGATLWSGHFDTGLQDIFAVQDELSRQVAGAIEPELLIGESRRARRQGSTLPDAYDFHMRGVWHHNQQDRAEDFATAIAWQRRAIAVDPGFARAHMLLARSLYARSLFGFSPDISRDAADCAAAAERALALDTGDAYSHYAACLAHLMAGRPSEALAAAEHATAINPSLALAHNAVGWARVFVGRSAAALAPLETAIRLSPRDPLTYLFLSRIGLARYHLGDYAAALDFSERALSLRRRQFITVVQLAALGQLGRLDEARSLLPALAGMTPAEAPAWWAMIATYLDPADRRHLMAGLDRARLQGLV